MSTLSCHHAHLHDVLSYNETSPKQIKTINLIDENNDFTLSTQLKYNEARRQYEGNVNIHTRLFNKKSLYAKHQLIYHPINEYVIHTYKLGANIFTSIPSKEEYQGLLSVFEHRLQATCGDEGEEVVFTNQWLKNLMMKGKSETYLNDTLLSHRIVNHKALIGMGNIISKGMMVQEVMKNIHTDKQLTNYLLIDGVGRISQYYDDIRYRNTVNDVSYLTLL